MTYREVDYQDLPDPPAAGCHVCGVAYEDAPPDDDGHCVICHPVACVADMIRRQTFPADDVRRLRAWMDRIPDYEKDGTGGAYALDRALSTMAAEDFAELVDVVSCATYHDFMPETLEAPA